MVKTTAPESIKSGIVVDNTSDHFILITEMANPCVSENEPERYTTCKIGDTEINKIGNIIQCTNWGRKIKQQNH